MSKRITDQQIELARTSFRSGRSIPECCQIASMSRASFNKYLGKEVQVWLDEHEQAKQKARIAEIVPESVTEVEPESEQLTYSQFESYAEFEFSNAPDDIVYLKNLYYELQEEYKQEYRFVIRLREIYEHRLSRIGKSDDSVEVVTSFSDGLAIKSALLTQQTIKAFKSKYNIKMPIPRLTTLRSDEWRSQHRVYEHLHYWYVAHHDSHKAAKQSIKDKSLAEYQQWFESFEQ